jgi:hypothetical protein
MIDQIVVGIFVTGFCGVAAWGWNRQMRVWALEKTVDELEKKIAWLKTQCFGSA